MIQTKQRFRNRTSDAQELRIQQRLRNNLERSMLRELNKIFRTWLSSTLFLYREYSTFQRGVAQSRLEEELIPALQRQYRKIFETIIESNVNRFQGNQKAEEALVFGRSINFEELVEEYFNNRDLVLSGISRNLANRIDKIIQQGRADDLTLDQIARNVNRILGPSIRARANLIARTETHNAASFANHRYYSDVADELEIKMKKRWIAISDARTRSFHADASGQVRDMDDDFDVGGAKMSYPGDPRGGARNVINCRCVVSYVDERDL